MARNPMQDIVPKGGKSIRSIPLPESRAKAVTKKEPVEVDALPELKRPRRRQVEKEIVPPKQIEEEEVLVEVNRDEGKDERSAMLAARDEFEKSASRARARRRKPRSWKKAGIAGGIVLVLALAFLVSNAFHGATLVLTPKSAVVPVVASLTANKDGALGISYDVITIKQTGSETVKATGEKQVDKRATGIIIIYNNYSSASQRLIKNTRFATPEGLIYRIIDSVTVPGKKGTIPGSIEATVTADEPGESYNVGLKDFTIPGFKGDPRYTAFYARSKTPLSGGFSGIQKIVADADRAKAKANIETKVGAELIKQLAVNIPVGKVTFDNAYRIEFLALPEESGSSNEAIIKEEGTISMAVFDPEELARAIALKHVPDYKAEPVSITNLGELSFTPKGELKPGSGSIAFTIAGDAKFQWLYDGEALRHALLDKPRAEVPAILQGYPMIEKADISIRPFWSRSFPGSPEDIVIKQAR